MHPQPSTLLCAVLLTSLCLLTSAGVCSGASPAPGPREPLTFRDMGLYGGWNEYWLKDDCPFDFFIVQAVMSGDKISGHGQEGATWNEYLMSARTKVE